MNDRAISKICLVIILLGILIFALTYEPEFKDKKISELATKEGEKGIIFARVEHVIKKSPITQAIITDGNKATIYFPKQSDINKNNFIRAYVISEAPGDNNQANLYAYKIMVEG